MTDVIEAMARAAQEADSWRDQGMSRSEARDAVRAALSAALERGWVLVPKEPVEEMLGSGILEIENEDEPNYQSVYSHAEMKSIYRAMLEKAPKPQSSPEVK